MKQTKKKNQKEKLQFEIANILTGEKAKLNGFKVLGIFPFYLKYITTGTHIQLCVIKERIQELIKGDPKVSDFFNSKTQKKVTPLINTYCAVALVNNRPFTALFKYLLLRKLKGCGHYHILNLYLTIQKLDEPAFFLTYWNLMLKNDHTLLKEVGHL